MDETEIPLQCSNSECKVAQDGRCVEGITELISCPHFGKSLVILESPKAAVVDSTAPGIRLPSAEALSKANAQLLVRNRRCNVISIVGPFESGKTSLIASAYDLFQHGAVGGFAFAGSSTLHAFERACHDSRRASNRERPGMERTQTGDATYFHLDLAHSGFVENRSALLANRAGEDYMDTQTDPTLANDFAELHLSDCLTLLADGTKLLDLGLRHQVRDDICITLRAFQEAGVTRPWQKLAIVLSKLDVIRANQDTGERAARFFESIVQDVRDQFSQSFTEIQSFRVAASPSAPTAVRGEGMTELFAYWMSETGRLKPSNVPITTQIAERAFGRLRPVKGPSNG